MNTPRYTSEEIEVIWSGRESFSDVLASLEPAQLSGMALHMGRHAPAPAPIFVNALDPKRPEHFVALLQCLGASIEGHQLPLVAQIIEHLALNDVLDVTRDQRTVSGFDIQYPLNNAIKSGSWEITRLLLEKADQHWLNYKPTPLLQIAVEHHNHALIDALLDCPGITRRLPVQTAQLVILTAAVQCVALEPKPNVELIQKILALNPQVLVDHPREGKLIGALAYNNSELLDRVLCFHGSRHDILTGAMDMCVSRHDLSSLSMVWERYLLHKIKLSEPQIDELMIKSVSCGVEFSKHPASHSAALALPTIEFLFYLAPHKDFETVLETACVYGSLELVDYFLRRTNTKPTEVALIAASNKSPTSQCADIVQLLLNHSPKLRCLKAWQMLRADPPEALVRLLLEHTPRRDLLKALGSTTAQPEVLKKMLDTISSQPLAWHERKLFENALLCAVRANNPQSMEVLLEYHLPRKSWSTLDQAIPNFSLASDLKAMISSQQIKRMISQSLSSCDRSHPSTRSRKM